MALGLFNTADQPTQIHVLWSSLNLSASVAAHRVRARDVWKHRWVEVSGDGYITTVPAHGVVMLHLTVQP
jgi:hypothetical protein